MLQEKAIKDAGYYFYFSSFCKDAPISIDFHHTCECVLALPEQFTACYFDYEKSKDQEQFLAYFMFEFGSILSDLKSKGWFFVYSMCLVFLLKVSKIILTKSESNCMLEMPEKKTKNNNNYCQNWEPMCFRDIEFFLQEARFDKIRVIGPQGSRNFSITQEKTRYVIFENLAGG